MNTQIHAQRVFNFNTIIVVLLILLQGLTLSAHAALVVEPVTSIIEIGKSINLSVTGASGAVTWTPAKGQIQGIGNRVTYIAPIQPGLDVVTVFDGTNVQLIKITVLPELTKTFSPENAVWEVFTNRTRIEAITLSDNGETLWIGTNGGLEKRDAITGKLIRIYTNLDGLPRNRVISLLADGNGGIWVGTDSVHDGGGLAHFYANGTWKIFNKDSSYLPGNYVSSISKDGNGGIWMGVNKGIGSSSLVHFHSNGTWNIFNEDNSNFPYYNDIESIFADGNGGIWIGTSEGLAHLNSKGNWKIFNTDNSSLLDNYIDTIAIDGSGGLWIENGTSWETGTNLSHLHKNGLWTHIDDSSLPYKYLRVLLNDRNGGLWVGGDMVSGDGLAHLNNIGQWTMFKFNNSMPLGLHNEISDGNGGLWMIGKDGLIHLSHDYKWTTFNTDNSGLPNNNIHKIGKDDNGLWVWTKDGLAHKNDNGEWNIFNNNNSGLPNNSHIKILTTDNNSGVWVGTWGDGIAHMNHHGQWTVFNTNNSGIHSNYIKTLISDDNDGVWVAGDFVEAGNRAGLAYMDSNGKWTLITKDLGLPNDFVQTLNYIETFIKDDNGGLWIGTHNGIAYRSNNGKWSPFGVNQSYHPWNMVYTILNDGISGIWMGTDGGLLHFNFDNNKFKYFTIHNSDLPENMIRSIEKGGNGGLWIGTNGSGLVHLTFTEKTNLCTNATSDAECEKLLKSRRAAIIVHPKGQGDGYNQETAVDFMATYAYQTLHARGYDNDEIYFLSYKPDLDINADGIADVNAVDAPVKFFEARDKGIQPRDLNLMDIRAAFNWAKQQGKLDYPLLVTFVDHGAPNRLLLDPLATQTLTGSEFKTILDDYQNTTGNQIAVILEACHTGTLVPTLAGTNRTIISSTGENQSFYNDLGRKSFLKFFFDRLRRGENFWHAWQSVKTRLSNYSWPHNQQVPQLNDSVAGALAQQLCLNGCFNLPGSLTLTVPKLPASVPLGQAIDLKVSTQMTFGHVQEVTVSLLSPDMTFNQFGHSYQPPQVTYLKPANTRSQAAQQQWQGQLSGDKLTTPGSYTLTFKARDNNGFSTDEHLTLCVGSESCQPNQTRLFNISTRAAIRGNASNIVAGFVIEGTGTQKVIIRGWGLGAGVDPNLLVQTFPEGKTIAGNNNWANSSRANEIRALPANLRLTNPTDAGLLLDLPAGAYTARLSSLGNKGQGLIGVNEVESNANTQLINISTRAPIEGGYNDIVAGFIITGTGKQKVLIRGWGIEEGVDPYILLRQDQTVLAGNNAWQNSPRAEEIARLPSNLQVSEPTDAALLVELPAGAYTVKLSSQGQKGLGLVGVNAID